MPGDRRISAGRIDPAQVGNAGSDGAGMRSGHAAVGCLMTGPELPCGETDPARLNARAWLDLALLSQSKLSFYCLINSVKKPAGFLISLYKLAQQLTT